MKPVELVAAHLKNSSPVGGIVADFFLGSGTALIAAEQLERICHRMDIDPVYCDVATARWGNLAGEHATRLYQGTQIRDGQTGISAPFRPPGRGAS